MIGDELVRRKLGLPSPDGGISAQMWTLRTVVIFVDMSLNSSPFVRFRCEWSSWLLPMNSKTFVFGTGGRIRQRTQKSDFVTYEFQIGF
jgi:hypothetical protein